MEQMINLSKQKLVVELWDSDRQCPIHDGKFASRGYRFVEYRKESLSQVLI